MTHPLAPKSFAPELLVWDGASVNLAHIGAPIAVCTKKGEVIGLSPRARTVLEGVGISTELIPFALPETLWAEFSSVPEGEAIEWRSVWETQASLGCTRYQLGGEHSVVLMREVSAKRREFSRRLHQQRLESTGRMVASIAHDVRTALASILYNSAFLSSSVQGMGEREVAEVATEIHDASRRLQGICNGLLGFAKLGPPVADDIPVQDVVSRVCSLVRPMYRERDHVLRAQAIPGALTIRGNSLLIDQILVNLLVNAAESSEKSLHVNIECGGVTDDVPPMVRIRVSDDGPGVPHALRQRIFEPFFTTHAEGSGLGLTTAREAAREMGGDLLLEPTESGARFVAVLPAGLNRRPGA